jgi:anthranilate synthase/aminodeoxychorismate synthase-like glutamine amidotransferase
VPAGFCFFAFCFAIGRRRYNPKAGSGGRTVPVAFGSMRVVVIDNYDSFVYNLVQYLGELGAEPIVHRHDALTLEQLLGLEPDAVLVSPGPGRPEDAGVSNEAIRAFGEHGVPVLGVCLGHQCIGQVYGGTVDRAPRVMHGKTSEITHDGQGVFAGIDSPFTATRYHSLVVERDSVPDELEVTAESEDGLVMGLRHREHPIEGVQFHPESILTESGHDLLRNFLSRSTAFAASS